MAEIVEQVSFIQLYAFLSAFEIDHNIFSGQACFVFLIFTAILLYVSIHMNNMALIKTFK